MHFAKHVCCFFQPVPVVFPVQELTQLQDKHATRPDVFDDVEEEQEIEILTQEITQVRTSDDPYQLVSCVLMNLLVI